MSLPASSTKALLTQLDSLIAKHGPENPELLSDLHAHRAALQEAAMHRNAGDFARHALELATWVKFVFDHLP